MENSNTEEFNSQDITSKLKKRGLDIDETLLDSFQLHNDAWKKWIYIIGPASAILQWLLVLPLALNNNVIFSDSAGFNGIGIQEGVAPTGFINDFFFIAWNIFPVLLLLVYIIADKFGTTWIRDVANNVDTKNSHDKIQYIRKIKNNRYIHAIIILTGLVGMGAQIPKQIGFFNNLTQLYWWDWRVSPAIFIIRDIALFFNTITVITIYWHTLLSSVEIIVSVKYGDVIPQFFHPDLSGGLMSYGNAITILVLPWIIGSFLGLLGYFDHGAPSEMLFRIADITVIILGTVVSLVILGYSLYVVKIDIQDDIERIQSHIHILSDQDSLGSRITNESPEELLNEEPSNHKLSESAPLILIRQRIDNINPWPIDEQRVSQILLVIVSPLTTITFRTLIEIANKFWF